jgi:hypothetical protein
MLRSALWITVLGLMVGGCASDGKMESSSTGSSTSDGGAAVSSPRASGGAVAEPSSKNQPNSSTSRIAAGVEEETLNTCLARIPQDATAGQRMLAEQTCRRDYGVRR